MSERFLREVVRLDNLGSVSQSNDVIVAGLNRLLVQIAQNGQSLCNGNLTIRTYYDAPYKRDEAAVTWERLDD